MRARGRCRNCNRPGAAGAPAALSIRSMKPSGISIQQISRKQSKPRLSSRGKIENGILEPSRGRSQSIPSDAALEVWITCSEYAGIALCKTTYSRLFLHLESQIGRTRNSHQQQQIGVEVGKHEIPDHIPDENNRQNAGPDHHLEPLQFGAFRVADEIFDKTQGSPGGYGSNGSNSSGRSTRSSGSWSCGFGLVDHYRGKPGGTVDA